MIRQVPPASAVLLASALGLAGCGADPEVLVGPHDVDGGTASVLVGGKTRDGMDALIVGELAMVGRCVGIVDGPYSYVVVWPAGTTLAGEGDFSIDVPDIGRLTPGEPVRMGGGYLRAPFVDSVPPIPDGCPDDEVALANSDQSG